MPRFHFDVRFGEAPWFKDEDGVVLKNLEQAKRAALKLALSLGQQRPEREFQVRILDDAQEPLFGMRLTLERWTRDIGATWALLLLV
jgi:hypothetical protein